MISGISKQLTERHKNQKRLLMKVDGIIFEMEFLHLWKLEILQGLNHSLRQFHLIFSICSQNPQDICWLVSFSRKHY